MYEETKDLKVMTKALSDLMYGATPAEQKKEFIIGFQEAYALYKKKTYNACQTYPKKGVYFEHITSYIRVATGFVIKYNDEKDEKKKSNYLGRAFGTFMAFIEYGFANPKLKNYLTDYGQFINDQEKERIGVQLHFRLEELTQAMKNANISINSKFISDRIKQIAKRDLPNYEREMVLSIASTFLKF